MAGGVLIAFGSLLGAVGLVLLILLAMLTGSGRIPEWLSVGPQPVQPSLRLLVLGALLVLLGVGQVVTGMAMMAPGRAWSRPAGMVLAVAGAALAAWALWPASGTGGSVQAAFLPVIAAYLFVALALILARGWFVRR